MAYVVVSLIIILIFGSCYILKNEYKWLYYKIKPYLTWRFILCFGIGWMITNGWCYVFIWLGTQFKIYWMLSVGLAYAAFLYFPFTAEKVVTIAIAIWLHKLFFPNRSTDELLSRFK